MKTKNEKIPNPKEIEKEISDFLSKKFGDSVKIVSPILMPQESMLEKVEQPSRKEKKNYFDLKPEELISYLDQYIIKQDRAKAILATKICTHFNRIQHAEKYPESMNGLVGSIKNNVLMTGPTGVGKTYMIKLIAKKIGVPFVKGDATKFSETGYVGGDVEDLVRDLVREADNDIELAQYGIIYIDEIDKIASSRNIIGADVSRTGVQRALLKPMEETEVDLKVPHDPISMIQEIERFRKTGKRERSTVNTKDILFIMSGAFSDLPEIIQKRMHAQGIGFGARITKTEHPSDILKHVKSEDLIEYGFESEFVGRLPVRSVFERLSEDDLYEILCNPNNSIILGKKLDFAAYDILKVFRLVDFLPVHFAYYVPTTHSGGFCGGVREHTGHQSALHALHFKSARQGLIQVGYLHAQKSPDDFAMLHELVVDFLCHFNWSRESDALSGGIDKGVYSNHFSIDIQKRAAGIPLVNRRVGLYEVLVSHATERTAEA